MISFSVGALAVKSIPDFSCRNSPGRDDARHEGGRAVVELSGCRVVATS
jgi:hypothetical protein